ncbi:MAG: 1-acyl-sn-glycerol-3-phosphate acyltransferase, partial [Pseudomonadota bacterium]
FWGQEGFRKTTGTAVLEFLDPIPPGLGKAAFMAQLTDVVETATAQLVGEARGTRPVAATLLPDPVKGVLAKPLTEATAALPAKPAK